MGIATVRSVPRMALPRWSRAGRILIALVAVMAFGAGVFIASLPSVADAPTRVASILRAHDAWPVQLKASSKLARAVVAVEDERFYEHGAVDAQSVGRALLTTLGGGSDPGGSTITQQLAKVLYVGGRETFLNRLTAIGVAYRLDDAYSKRTILNMYLNAIYFGHGFYGADQASRGYFGRRVGGLSWGQAALLAGLPQAPSSYDPFRHLERARSRQLAVLAQLVDNGVLSKAAAARHSRAPLRLVARRVARGT